MRSKHTPCLPADAEGIARAIEVLRAGGLVAIPTETVYGLAARADSEEAVARIFAAKGRPGFNPLIVHIADFQQAAALCDLSQPVARWHGMTDDAADLGDYAATCWPGPTTLVVPRPETAPVARAATAGLASIGLRMPAHRVARAVIEGAGPLAAPSANRSGFTSPTTAAHVLATLDGLIDLVLDGGPTEGGIESTILKLRDDGRWQELRPGPVDTALWLDSHFARNAGASNGPVESPGQLASHYSPGKPVRLDASTASGDEFHIGFGLVDGDLNLSPAADLTQAARALYAALHEAARSALPRIAVAPIPEEALGAALNDRLRRAAA